MGFLGKHEGEVSEGGSGSLLGWGQENEMGQGQGPRGQIQSVIKARRTSFPCDKGPLMEDRHGLWNHIQPQRDFQAFQSLWRPESLAGSLCPVFGGWGTRLNRRLSR